MLIGLSVNCIEGKSCLADAYVQAVIKAGGTPVMIPFTTDKTVLKNIISNMDGLILSGGGDVYSRCTATDISECYQLPIL